MSKSIIGILEVSRFIEKNEETTEWTTFVIAPDADYRGAIFQKINKVLSEKNYLVSYCYIAGIWIHQTAESSKIMSLLKKIYTIN